MCPNHPCQKEFELPLQEMASSATGWPALVGLCLSFLLWMIHLTRRIHQNSRRSHEKVISYPGGNSLLWRENVSQSHCFVEYGVCNSKMPAGCISLCAKSHNFPCHFQPVNSSQHDSRRGFSTLTIHLKT